jgi:hypothetical protein
LKLIGKKVSSVSLSFSRVLTAVYLDLLPLALWNIMAVKALKVLRLHHYIGQEGVKLMNIDERGVKLININGSGDGL